MPLDGADPHEVRTAGVHEGLAPLNADLLERLEALGQEAGGDHRHSSDATLRQFPENVGGGRCQPLLEAEL